MHNLHQMSLDRAGGPRSDVQGGSTRGVPGLMFRGASAGGGGDWWVAILWGPMHHGHMLIPCEQTGRQTRVKTWPSRNFDGGR